MLKYVNIEELKEDINFQFTIVILVSICDFSFQFTIVNM